MAYSAAWPFTIERPYIPEMAPFIPEIEKIVNEILTGASERVDDPNGLIRELQVLDVTLRMDDYCESRGVMWTELHSPDPIIYVCSDAIELLQKYQNQEIFINLAQTLIHESIHHIGYVDECVTTEIELILMKYSPYADDVYHSDYVDECGLSD